MIRYIFQENADIAMKNRGKDITPDIINSCLKPYTVKRDFLVIQKKARKIYYTCVRCGDRLESKVLKSIGYCMMCERG